MITRSRRPLGRLALASATALLLAACGGSEDAAAPPAPEPSGGDASGDSAEDTASPAAEPLAIVVTTSILGDVVAELVGDDGDVRVLMDAGVDPHGYQASAADAAAMREADLVVANGLQLEEGLISALETARDEGVRVIELAPGVDPIPFEGEHDHGDDHAHEDDHDHGDDHAHEDEHDHGDDKASDEHDHDHDHDHGDDHAHEDDHGDDHAHDDDKVSDEHDHDHDHGEEDPHFWFDPLRMADAVDVLATALADVRTDVDWTARAATQRAELEALDAEVAALFATIPEERRKLVTNHDALGYLADRYDLEVVGTVLPGASTSVESNPQAFARLVDLLVAEGIDVVFAETTDTTTLADALASEVIGRSDLDVQVVQLYTGSLGEPGTGADTYVGMVRTTATLITDALTG